MRTGFSHINELWGFLAVEELFRAGVTSFCISPGARSTPLVYAVSENKWAAPNKRAVPVIHYDERGAAFYALGHARATGQPAAVICTSGTAAANFLPAVIEASVDHVPLIILTADRPPELRKTGANQTIDQVKIFGDYVRWQMDLPCPDEKISPEFVLTTIDQAVYRSLRSPAGPVHLNFMFREPLAPSKEKQNYKEYLKNVAGWMNKPGPYTKYVDTKAQLSDETIKEIAKLINGSKSGLMVVGKIDSKAAAPVLSLAEKIGWPVFPDIASGLRLGVKGKNIVPHFDLVLLSESFQKFKPDTVLHFGNQPVSKRLGQFLDSVRPPNYIRIAPHPERLDPHHQVTLRIESDISDFCTRAALAVTKKGKSANTEKFINLSVRVDKIVTGSLGLDKDSRITEPALTRIISQQISKSGALFLASSLPVREMDMFADSSGHSVAVEYNRGASGIDGTIASAVGYANGLKKPVTLLIGDLAFLHDLNSLALVQESRIPLIIVIINNDGGGIFSFLPVAEMGKAFEPFFGTPHGLSFQKSADQFQIDYHHPQTIAEFGKIYTDSQRKNSSVIIETTTNRQTNWDLHQKISQNIKMGLAKV